MSIPRSRETIRAAGGLGLSVGLALILVALPCSGGWADSLTAEPRSIRLEGRDSRQQLAVSIQAADGALSDSTRGATYSVQPADFAAVSPDGVVTPRRDGEGTIRIEARGRTLDVPIRVERADAPRVVSFRRDVTALLAKAGCNMGACHGNLNGKGGFKLSLRGDDPTFDYLSLTHDTFGRRIDRNDATQSLAYRKPTGMVPHEGGLRFAPGSIEARTLRGWIDAGATDDVASVPALARLTVWPVERLIAAPGRSQQLIVTAEFTDGTRRDVTRQASYDVNDPSTAEVTADGRVLVNRGCEVAVAVRYLQGRGVSRLAFLADRPGFVWNGPEATSAIDRAVFAKLKALKINPSESATESVFLRRAYLDAIGMLPEIEEARAYLDDPDPNKRDKLIDRLVNRPEFAEFWALKWADLLRNEEKTMGAKGVWVFQRWLRDQIAADVPMDQFARRVVSSVGSTWSNPPASFYRTNRDPETAAESVGQVFLGVRLQCARCHNHPFDIWTQDDYYGLAAYFSNLGHKIINNDRRDKFDKHEINGDEVIYLTGKPELAQPRSGEMMSPKPLGAPGHDLAGDRFALDDLADWLTRENPQFTRNLANRVWFHLLGRGVVDPVDDFRDSNPPSNPALLDALTEILVQNGMRLRPLVRSIMTSKVYQLSATPNETNAEDEANFARYPVKLLSAEVLFDALGQALGARASLSGPTASRQPLPGAPEGARASQLPGVRFGGEFLKVFGKPERLLTCECERSDGTTLAQAFQLINGDMVRGRLESPSNRIGRGLESGRDAAALLDELYLAALCRAPSASEQAGALAHIRSAVGDRRAAWEDVAWAILNSKEFLLRH